MGAYYTHEFQFSCKSAPKVGNYVLQISAYCTRDFTVLHCCTLSASRADIMWTALCIMWQRRKLHTV